ncbi:MAG TPA: GIY-YIG nuclease family protein [Patescibacteria group bacterium]|nr:GIY-YIG nuclease family protein [Patescibacteria group bacterium]
MHYVYILRSETTGRRYYGSTRDLRKRFTDHNAGQSFHTRKERPWRVVWYAAFSTKALAESFETYLKSSSGHGFSRKRLL